MAIRLRIIAILSHTSVSRVIYLGPALTDLRMLFLHCNKRQRYMLPNLYVNETGLLPGMGKLKFAVVKRTLRTSTSKDVRRVSCQNGLSEHLQAKGEAKFTAIHVALRLLLNIDEGIGHKFRVARLLYFDLDY